MWIVIAFDLPVETPQDRKNYQILRKQLLASGFTPIQRSLLWRWVENKETADSLIAKLRKHYSNNGKIIFFCIPDTTFGHTKLLENGSAIAPPSPPLPWTILT